MVQNLLEWNYLMCRCTIRTINSWLRTYSSYTVMDPAICEGLVWLMQV